MLGLTFTRKAAGELGKIAQSNAGVQNVMVINGFDLLGGGNKTNAATMFIPLKHWDERKGIASAYGPSGSFMSCEYQMSTPMLGAGTCNFSNGARYKLHVGN